MGSISFKSPPNRGRDSPILPAATSATTSGIFGAHRLRFSTFSFDKFLYDWRLAVQNLKVQFSAYIIRDYVECCLWKEISTVMYTQVSFRYRFICNKFLLLLFFFFVFSRRHGRRAFGLFCSRLASLHVYRRVLISLLHTVIITAGSGATDRRRRANKYSRNLFSGEALSCRLRCSWICWEMAISWRAVKRFL